MAGYLSKRQILAAAVVGLLPRAAFADDIVRVPFRLYRGRTPVISVMLGGKGPFAFAFGSASPLNSIDAELAEQLGLNRVAGSRGSTVSPGSVSREIDVECPSVVIGGIGKGYDLKSRVFALNARRKANAEHYLSDPDAPRGIIGSVLFRGAPCVLDYEAGELRFHLAGAPGLDGFSPLGVFNGRDRTMSAQAGFDDQKLKCWLDSSGATELYLTSKYVQAHNLYDKYPVVSEELLNRLEPDRGVTRVVRLKNFQLGAFHFDEINAQLGDPKHSDHLDQLGISAIVGRGLLRNFTLAFTGDQVYARPNGQFAAVSPAYVPPPAD